nr:hypothetical protein [Bradyrhizobium japonicum]
MLGSDNRPLLACIMLIACDLLDSKALPSERPDYVIRISAFRCGKIPQGGPFHSADDAVNAIEHGETASGYAASNSPDESGIRGI